MTRRPLSSRHSWCGELRNALLGVPLIILKFAGLATPSIHAGFRAKTNTIVM
jgi:hypothetical protein